MLLWTYYFTHIFQLFYEHFLQCEYLAAFVRCNFPTLFEIAVKGPDDRIGIFNGQRSITKSENSSLAKISQQISIHKHCRLKSILMNSIERGLIHSRCSTGKLNKLNLKIVSYKLTVVIRTAERSIIATEEKCRQFNWCFRYNMVIIIQDATFYLKCL